jgi:hypothetical protein
MISFSDKINYLKTFCRSFLKRPRLGLVSDTIKYYPAWRNNLAPGKSSVTEKMPWITFSAIDQLKKIVRPDMEVFEYGSGGSTLFWASRVKKVVSVEHDKEWFGILKGQLGAGKSRQIEYLLIEPQSDAAFGKKRFEDPDDYVSSDEHYRGMNFERYVKAIDVYPDNHFDVIIVDGRARPSCIKHALPKLKPNGWLVVDNSDRSYYLAPFSFDTTGWKVLTFEGPVPFMKGFSRTSLFQKLRP